MDSGLDAPQRLRALSRNVTAAVAGKGLVAATQIAMLPLMLTHLGATCYGIWVTLQSILSLTALFDLGISNASVNDVAEASARGDADKGARVIGTSLVLLGGCAVGAAVVFAGSMFWMAERSCLEMPGLCPQTDVSGAILVFAAVLLVTIPLGLIEPVMAAFQQTWITTLPRVGAAIGALVCGWAALTSKASFAWVCAATAIPGALGLLAAWGFAWWLQPAIRLQSLVFDRSAARELIATGLAFYGIQVCGVLGFGIDNALIYAVVGPECVTAYAAPHRFFSLVVIAVTLVLGPLWPAYTRAIADGDMVWARHAFRLSLVFASLSGVVGASAVAMALPWITKHWLADEVTVSLLMTCGFLAMVVSQCMGVAVAMYWNATRQLRLQFRLSTFFVLVATPLKLLAIKMLGIDWLPVLGAASYVVTILLPAIAIFAIADWRAPPSDGASQPFFEIRS